jgi:hypothetical protein
MPDPAQLWSLPDDVLRVVATFMPPSGLIVLVQSSRTIARVLRGHFTRCLDDLFIMTQSEIQFEFPFLVKLHIQPQPCEVAALFGDASVDFLADPATTSSRSRRDAMGLPKISNCIDSPEDMNTVAIWSHARDVVRMLSSASRAGCSASSISCDLPRHKAWQILHLHHGNLRGGSLHQPGAHKSAE